MKKIYLAVFLACSMGGAVHAQIGGGLPLSMSIASNKSVKQSVKVIELKSQDFATALKTYEANGGSAKAYLGGVMVDADITLDNSGNITYLEDGRKIWRTQIHVDGVQAINLYYDNFRLPAGVKYFLYNANEKQIVGAFTSDDNPAGNMFATTSIQGGLINLEMNIDADVNVKDIQFHINKVGAIHRGEELLNKYYGTLSNTQDGLLKPTEVGDASPCHINAMCPAGDAYSVPKSSTARIVIPLGGNMIGYCSGTLLNNAANACKPYFLTASHCDGENVNGTTDAHFSQWMFDFNLQFPNCAGTGDPFATMRTITGGLFRARSKFPSSGNAAQKDAVGDFLFLELASAPLASWNVYLAGWNRDAAVFSDPNMDFFIGFHHPAGDAKKLSTTDNISPTGTFNQSTVPATHWDLSFNQGFSEGGSSGSGLFDKNGRLIGDLSGGEIPAGNCAPAGPQAKYSKLSTAWNYSFDPNPGPATRLKEWLDPNNTGTNTVNAQLIPCSPVGIKETGLLNESVLVYPNPASDFVRIKVNLPRVTTLEIEVVEFTGRRVSHYTMSNISSGERTLDMSGLSNGIYLLNITDKAMDATISRKVVLNHP